MIRKANILIFIITVLSSNLSFGEDINQSVIGEIIGSSPELGIAVINLGKKDGVLIGDEVVIKTKLGNVNGLVSYTLKSISDIIISDATGTVSIGDKCHISCHEENSALTLDILEAELSSASGEVVLKTLVKDMKVKEKPPEPKVKLTGSFEVGGTYEEYNGVENDNNTNGRTSLELELNGNPSPLTNWTLGSETEKSDTSFFQNIYGDFETQLTDKLELETSMSIRLWDYTNDIIDDQITSDDSFELTYDINEKWSVKSGINTYFLTEYEAHINNGYSLYEPYIQLSYEYSPLNNINLTYTYSDKNNRADDDEIYNYSEDNLELDITFMNSKLYTYSDLEYAERDYNQANNENDYEQISFYNYTSYNVVDKWTLGFTGDFEARAYEITGASDTDYIDWNVSPSISWSPVTWLTITLSGNYRHWQNRDRHPNDSRDKSLENFYEQGGEIYLSWYISQDCSLSLSHKYTERKYPRGETGTYPYYSTDYSLVANRHENISTANLYWDITDNWEIQGGIYYFDQKYPNFPDNDNDYFSADLALKYSF